MVHARRPRAHWLKAGGNISPVTSWPRRAYAEERLAAPTQNDVAPTHYWPLVYYDVTAIKLNLHEFT